MRGASPSAGTAETLILIGLILDLILAVIFLVAGLVISIIPLISGLLIVLALIGFFWSALVYGFSYRRVVDGFYQEARTPTLIFAILSIFTAQLVPGILFLIAYSELGDAIEEGQNPFAPWATRYPPYTPGTPVLFGGAVPGTRYCSYCGRASTGGSFCQGCGARLQ